MPDRSGQLGKDLMALYQLVLNVLAGKEAHTLRVVVAQLLKHLVVRAVFAS